MSVFETVATAVSTVMAVLSVVLSFMAYLRTTPSLPTVERSSLPNNRETAERPDIRVNASVAGRFVDPVTGTGPARISLQHVRGALVRPNVYRVGEQFGYIDADHGYFIVPADPSSFYTDLTSLPAIFQWIFPTRISLAPAAVLHDALISEPGEPPHFEGPPTTRRDADEIFRRALGELGSSPTRRWLMWAVAAFGTMASGSWVQRLVAALTVMSFATVSWVQLLDMFDVVGFLPWSDQSIDSEVMGAILGSLLVPLLAAPLWGKSWRAAIIIGWPTMLLIFPIVLVGTLQIAYVILMSATRGKFRIRSPL